MISQNINIIKSKIADACAHSGRNPEDVKLIAVTKNTGLKDIQQAIESGISNLGENKAQEFAEKCEIIKNVHWHFIGHLQRNKVKHVIGAAEYIHSIDSLRLAQEINVQASIKNIKQKVLLEVNVAGEEAKYGIKELTDLLQLAGFCKESSNLELAGLMTMAPLFSEGKGEKIIRKCFNDLRKLSITLDEQGIKTSELSMGMTNDYEMAIEEGATMLRLGTAIFGERDYSKNWKEL